MTRQLQGSAHYWREMLALQASVGAFTVRDVHQRCNGVGRSAVQAYVNHCVAVGVIEQTRVARPHRNALAAHYRVVKPDAAAPKLSNYIRKDSYGARQQQIWTTMRVLRTFTLSDLALTASTDKIVVSVGRAQQYTHQLALAGYIAEVGDQTPRAYKLRAAMNTGPKAPVVTKAGVFDRNLARLVNPNLVERRAA